MLEQIDASGGTGKTFYEVTDRDVLAWFLKQNYRLWKDRGLRHFTIATVNDITDVLALQPPILETQAHAPETAPVKP